MLDIWVKLVSNQFELGLNLTRAIFGLGAMKAPVSENGDTATAMVPGQAEADIIPRIISFLEYARRGATVREVAEHLGMDKKSVLPLLKTLVKERRIDELLGRYCVLKN